MINRADIPDLLFPDRRMKEVDGIALGKELTGLIRGAKTRGAVNRALAQHGTLGTPEAIETVRQGMGTWFSDPQKIIELQDTLYTREKEGREEKRKIKKLDSELKVLNQNLLESKDRMDKAAKAASRAKSTADFNRASTTITSNISAIEKELGRIYKLAENDPSILQTYAEHIRAYQEQIGAYNKLLTELAIGPGIEAGGGTDLDIPTLELETLGAVGGADDGGLLVKSKLGTGGPKDTTVDSKGKAADERLSIEETLEEVGLPPEIEQLVYQLASRIGITNLPLLANITPKIMESLHYEIQDSIKRLKKNPGPKALIRAVLKELLPWSVTYNPGNREAMEHVRVERKGPSEPRFFE